MFSNKSITLWFISASILTGQPHLLPSRVSLETNQGFCQGGAYWGTQWTEDKTAGLHTWGSFCAQGDQNTGIAVTTPFTAPAHLHIYLAGYPSHEGISLEIENISDDSKIRINPVPPREKWLLYEVPLPSAWLGKPVHLIARDQSVAFTGWLAFSEPVEDGSSLGLNEATSLLLRTLSHFILTVLPCLAACALAIRKGIRNALIVALVALATTGACGYLVFWLWFLWPKLGHVIAFLFPIAAGVSFAWTIRQIDVQGRNIIKQLAAPFLMTGVAALLILSTGFLYGGIGDPLSTASVRFSHPLPPDNTIPYIFAEAVRARNIPKPLLGDWRSSDRPPLQTGIVLSQYPYNPTPRALGYEVHSVILQSLWIFALWILLKALGIDQRAIVLVLFVCLFSGFVLVNSFFVWPKLLAASYMMGLFALLFSDELRTVVSQNKLVAALAGVLLAFGLLSHGGSAFEAIGIVLTMVVLRKPLPLKSFLLIAGTAFALYLPWMLYQKFYDPPGDRLLKFHLAAVEKVDPQPLLPTLISAYGKLTARQIADNKLQNFVTATDNLTNYWKTAGRLLRSGLAGDRDQVLKDAASLRIQNFFFFASNLTFLITGLPCLLFGIGRKYRSLEWKCAAVLALSVSLTIAIWCLLMFGPGKTVIHQGTYVTVLLGYAACLLSLWALSHRLAILIAATQIAVTILLYISLMWPLTQDGLLMPREPIRYGTLTLLFVSLGLVFILARNLWNEGPPLERFTHAPGAREPATIPLHFEG